MVILLVVKRNEDRCYKEFYVQQQQEGTSKVTEFQKFEKLSCNTSKIHGWSLAHFEK